MSHGILSDEALKYAIDAGEINISPFKNEQLNGVSYDLLLGKGVRVYKKTVKVKANLPQDGTHIFKTTTGFLDPRENNHTHYFEIPKDGFILKPGIGYLLHTEESIFTNTYVPVIDGKSSIGRLFLTVHITAGYGDPGFVGQYTLEAVATHRIKIYAGMRVCQIRFHTVKGKPTLYANKGRYTGNAATGPVASLSYLGQK